MADALRERRAPFQPSEFTTFRFVARELDDDGRIALRYALDDAIELVERFELPIAAAVTDVDRERVDGLLALLHWVAGVSYFKTAAPPEVRSEAGAPPPATARLLEALYSEGLGEFAYVNELPRLPRPKFAAAPDPTVRPKLARDDGPRVLVPVGGGKDSVVALEIVRRSGLDMALFSVGDATPIARTAAVAGLPHLIARRRIDPGLGELNRTGALNGHVPVTAIVTCVAMIAAALNGFDAVAMANERSASQGNLHWDGVEVNHQFSKGLAAERLLRAATAELAPGMETFSLLRPLPHRPGAAGDVLVSRLPEVPLRLPRAGAVQRAGAPERGLRRRPARRRAPVRWLRAADGDRRQQAVRVRRRGGGEPRGNPAARRRPALARPRRRRAAGVRGASPFRRPCRAARGRAGAQRRPRGPGGPPRARTCGSRSLTASG